MDKLTKALISLILLIIVTFCVSACSGLEQSEQEKLRRMNAKGEYIFRSQSDATYAISPPVHRERENYPWEDLYHSKHSKITKDYFRCKGISANPLRADYKDPSRPVNYIDCGGFQKHSLPIREGREFIYPILVDLLNYLQEKTQAKVVVTCGHRCPVHNAYADSSIYNQNSKHMIGAEVDFYVQGWEHRSEEIVKLLMQYYQDPFLRLELDTLNVSTPPWYNKEILIKLYQKHEGRDFDNRHPYPYLSIQVRFDQGANEKVICSWDKAFRCYRRY